VARWSASNALDDCVPLSTTRRFQRKVARRIKRNVIHNLLCTSRLVSMDGSSLALCFRARTDKLSTKSSNPMSILITITINFYWPANKATLLRGTQRAYHPASMVGATHSNVETLPSFSASNYDQNGDVK